MARASSFEGACDEACGASAAQVLNAPMMKAFDIVILRVSARSTGRA
jgi:hypothetical protein